MIVLKYKVQTFAITLVILLFLISKSLADDSVPNSDETAVQKEKPPVAEKVQDSKPDESEPQSNEENKGSEIKTDKCEPQVETDDSQPQNTGAEVNNDLKAADTNSKSSAENIEESNSQPDTPSEKTDSIGLKKEDVNQSPENVDAKKQSTKDDSNHKTDLNDVNFLREGEERVGQRFEKREAFRESMTDYLGLPRDASYFFDDLEPFFNDNNSDSRVGRSAPSKESKGQKSKLTKGRDIIEVDDADEEEDDLKDEEEEDEKQNEDDYDDDDDDMDSDCKPTTPACTTKPQCTTPSTCPPPTTKKCTTQFQCPTKCPTTPPCPTKCPRICAKANKKKIGLSLTTEKTINWDADKKRLNSAKKRRFHSKIAPNN